jgi:electron transport complex protein RnfB
VRGGFNACAKCVKECPAKCITMDDNRITIDHKACLAYGPDCNQACAEACPRDILRELPHGVAALRGKAGVGVPPHAQAAQAQAAGAGPGEEA